MVTKRKQHSSRRPVKQGRVARAPRPNKIGASTPYHFRGKNLTPYGGLLPVATLLEKLGFQALLEETITTKRITRAMSPYQFVLALVLGLYVGFARLNQLRFIARDPILTGILQVTRLPPQSTLWRFLASLHLNVAKQILSIQRQLRERVWAAAQVKLETVTLDTDTTVHTLYGRQMGGRKSYNPKNKGKRSYQPILTFLAETREYLMGGLRGGDRPTGQQIAAHLESAFRALPGGVKRILARADAGFYCWEAVAAYQQAHCQFVIVARKTRRLVEQLQQAAWKPSPHSDAEAQCEFLYQPQGWAKACRFLALRYEKEPEAGAAEQYQLFATSAYTYRVFVTNLAEPIAAVVWFYNQRAAAENLMIKEANNDAGLETLRHTTLATARLRFLFVAAKIWRHAGRTGVSYSDHYQEKGLFAAHPSRRFDMNRNHFQLAMLAYNLNCWLLLFNREAQASVETLRHTTLATARLRFLFVAAKIWRHAGRTGVSYSDHYQEKGLFERLMRRLRAMAPPGTSFAPVVEGTLR